MIEIKEITEKNVWEKFLLSQSINSFFQSWAWGEVQRNSKFQIPNSKFVWMLGVYDGNELAGIAQIIKVAARRGPFLHLRHGPVFKEWKKEYFEKLLDYLKQLGRKEKVWFIRISPQLPKTQKEFFKKFGFGNAPIHGQDAELAWVLNLDKSEEELLMAMRKTTRYLIKKAKEMGVEIKNGENEKDFKIFLKLYQQTVKRSGFVSHKSLHEEWEILKKEEMVKMYLAQYQKKILAGALIVFYGDQAIYHHSGGILNEIPANYGLLWQAILEAKKMGKRFFNFWGIAPSGKKHHPWRGFTLFKTGFGGQSVEYLHAQDLPLSKFYYLTWIIETMRRMKRGY